MLQNFKQREEESLKPGHHYTPHQVHTLKTIISQTFLSVPQST